MILLRIFIGLALWAICFPVFAEDRCLPSVEEHPRWQSAIFRPHTDVFRNCPVSEETYQSVVRKWLQNRTDTTTVFKSIGLGRAINYPWMSEFLAKSALVDPRWDPENGRTDRGHINDFVASILSKPAFINRLQVPFTNTLYTVIEVSVEKVLVSDVKTILSDTKKEGHRVPYDALVWIVISKIVPH